MDENIYEVEKDEYKGFLSQIDPKKYSAKQEKNDGVYWIKIYSTTTGKLLCARELYSETYEEHYYVFEMPPVEDRIKPKPVMKITLDDPKEIQEFYKIIAQAVKEQEDARNL